MHRLRAMGAVVRAKGQVGGHNAQRELLKDYLKSETDLHFDGHRYGSEFADRNCASDYGAKRMVVPIDPLLRHWKFQKRSV